MQGNSEPNCRHLEQRILQRVGNLYCEQLGHCPGQVSCKLAEQTLTIVVENSITKPEQLLISNGQQELAERVRANIHQATQAHFKALIEEVIAVPVIDLFSSTKFATGRTSTIAVLANQPEVDKLASMSKAKEEKNQD